MNTTFIVENGTQFNIKTMTLKNLYEMGSKGVDGEEAEINSAGGFLQRLAQKEEWNRHDKRRAKAYLRSLVKGSGLLDSFVVVPADLLLVSVKNNMIDASEEAKLAWEQVENYVTTRMEMGAIYFIIDGQNRLNESIVPFFDNLVPFGSDEALVFSGSDGSRINVAGKLYGDLPLGITKYIDNIVIPFVTATQGEIKQFSDALIWKNEGIAWDDWQKIITENWYTKFRRQVSEIASKDEGDTHCINAFERISGAKFAYDVNGYDLVAAQLLIWMSVKIQPSKIEDFHSFFTGINKVSEKQIDALKKYLKEFDGAYDKKQVTNTELRNYVMLRYALDNPKEFDKIAVPNWIVKKGVNFASIFKILNTDLIKNPERYGEVESYNIFTPAGGTTTKSKKPGSYVYYNSESKQDFLTNRLVILFNVLTNAHGKTPQVIIDSLWKVNTVVEYDTTPMSSLEEVYINNPVDSRGNSVPVSAVKSRNFDRGHKIAKSKGGSNTDLVLQSVRENRQLQDKYVG